VGGEEGRERRGEGAAPQTKIMPTPLSKSENEAGLYRSSTSRLSRGGCKIYEYGLVHCMVRTFPDLCEANREWS